MDNNVGAEERRMEKPRPRNSPNKPPFTLSVAS